MTDDDRPQESVGPRQRRHLDAFADLDRSAVAALDSLSYREVGRVREQDLLRIAWLGHVTLNQATHSLGALISPKHDLLTGITKSVAGSIGSVMDDFEARQQDLLDAVRLPGFNLQANIAGSALGDIGARQRELMDTIRLPRVDFPVGIAESTLSDIRAAQREMLNTIHRPLFESQRSLVDSLPPSFLERPIDLLDTARRPWLETPLVVDLPVPNPGIYTQDRQHRRPTRECVTAPADVIELVTSESLVARLVCVQGVFTDSFVEACLEDIRCSLEDGRPIAAVDRAHTVVHRMLQLLAEEHGWELNRHEGVPDLFRYLRQNHPAFMVAENGGSGVELFGKLNSLLQTLTEARNQHSLAHPTERQLSSPWARFVVRSALAIFELLADLRTERRIEAPVSASRRQN